MPVRRALISVADKTGVAEFAAGLAKQGVEVISTGGTLSVLREAGVEARPVEDLTGFPEILDGRVKTLHPHLHAGLLAVRDNPWTRESLLGAHEVKSRLRHLPPNELERAQQDVAALPLEIPADEQDHWLPGQFVRDRQLLIAESAADDRDS